MAARPPAATPVDLGLRTGPLGRGVRLIGAVVFGLGISSLVSLGPGHFGGEAALRSPTVWVLTVVVAILLGDLIVRFLPVPPAVRGLVLAALVAGIAAAAAISAAAGPAWSPPLTSLVWWIDVADLCFSASSLLLAIPIGTPGCEKMAWAELYAMLRGRRLPAGRWCIGGLHVVDNWEIGRRVTGRPG